MKQLTIESYICAADAAAAAAAAVPAVADDDDGDDVSLSICAIGRVDRFERIRA